MPLDKKELFLIGCFAFGAGYVTGKLFSGRNNLPTSDLEPDNTPESPASKSNLNLRVDYHRMKSRTEKSSSDTFLDAGIGGVFRLVLTGGPCAGKSTTISTLSSYLRSKGFAVIHVQETATSLKNTGIHWSPDLADEFQGCCVSVQSNRENIAVGWAEKLAEKCLKKKCIVIYDRGLVDGLAFVTQECLDKSCENAGISKDLFQRYDCVFHLVTAADGAELFYQKTSYRHESPEDAIRQDKKLQAVWSGHPNHFIFENTGTFQQKMEDVINKLCDCLGIMTYCKKSRRFLLKKDPDIPAKQPHFSEKYLKVYINSPWQEPGYVCSFLRRSERNQAKTYQFKTILSKEGQTIERKRRLTKAEFDMYMALQEEKRLPVKQRRKYITEPNGAFLEITCYDEPSKGLCLLNVFQEKEFDTSSLPSYLSQEIVKEVTGDSQYSAHHLSLKNTSDSVQQ